MLNEIAFGLKNVEFAFLKCELKRSVELYMC